MKKAVLYARVSSDLQKKEHTIESQIVELRKQVGDAHDVLVKEYIDDGYSGARLDRPALDQLRNDLKTPLFDTIYFLNTDRIARDVTYQTIIIAEILKHQKQIIINGVDYVHNPENKFTLTVLGAVAELERAKIIERVTRAKQLRLAQGCLLGSGANIYGYDYRRRTPAAPALDEQEAAVVREIFATYAKGQVGLNQITRGLEDRGVPTKGGHKLWRTSLLKQILRNETYCGVKYFNTQRRVREYANPLHGTRQSSSKCMKRPRNEWVGVKVPAIVSQALFDEVQERFAWNQQHYRNPRRVQLLSSLIRCGSCGGSFFGYRRYFTKDLKHEPGHVYHKAAYTCNWRHRAQMHSKKSNIARCHNKEVKAELLDARVCAMIEESLLDPEKLKGCMHFFKGTTRAAHLKLTQDLRSIDRRVHDVDEAKHRIIDVYASGDLERDAYVELSLDYDQELNALRRHRAELIKKIRFLHKAEAVDVSITQYCSAANVRFRSCVDFPSRRQFLLDHIDKVVFSNDRVELHGSVPVRVSANEAATDEADDSKIDFCIEDRITRSDWLASRRASMAEALQEA